MPDDSKHLLAFSEATPATGASVNEHAVLTDSPGPRESGPSLNDPASVLSAVVIGPSGGNRPSVDEHDMESVGFHPAYFNPQPSNELPTLLPSYRNINPAASPPRIIPSLFNKPPFSDLWGPSPKLPDSMEKLKEFFEQSARAEREFGEELRAVYHEQGEVAELLALLKMHGVPPEDPEQVKKFLIARKDHLAAQLARSSELLRENERLIYASVRDIEMLKRELAFHEGTGEGPPSYESTSGL